MPLDPWQGLTWDRGPSHLTACVATREQRSRHDPQGCELAHRSECTTVSSCWRQGKSPLAPKLEAIRLLGWDGGGDTGRHAEHDDEAREPLGKGNRAARPHSMRLHTPSYLGTDLRVDRLAGPTASVWNRSSARAPFADVSTRISRSSPCRESTPSMDLDG